jgi:hypothetical protein
MFSLPASALQPRTIPKLWPSGLKIPDNQKQQIFNPLALRNRLNATIETLKPIAIAEMESQRVVHLVDHELRAKSKNSNMDGERRYTQIKKDIDTLFPNNSRFDFQQKLHKQMFRVCMKHILGNDYHLLINRISAIEGWDYTAMNVVFIAPRRGGKSIGTSTGLAALVNNIPNFEVVVFSGGFDSAIELNNLCGHSLRKIARGKNIKVTKRKTTVYHPGGEESTVTPFPSNGQYDVSIFCFYSVCCLLSKNLRPAMA